MMIYFGKRMLLPTFRGRLVFSTILDLIIIIILRVICKNMAEKSK